MYRTCEQATSPSKSSRSTNKRITITMESIAGLRACDSKLKNNLFYVTTC